MSTVGHAYRLVPGKAPQNLGTLTSGTSSVGLAINASNQVAGKCGVSTVNFHGCVYTDGKGWVDVGLFNIGKEDPTTQPSSAAGINANGQATGAAPWLDPVSFSQFNHAYRYTSGTKTDLGALLGPDDNSAGAAINDSGVVAGSSGSSSGQAHATIWNGTTITDLGLLPGAVSSFATGINASGHVVGTSSRPNCSGYHCTPNGFNHAFLYSPASGMLDLGTLGGVVSTALGIDANDDVVGASTVSGTTVPNPGHVDPNRLAFLYTGGQMINLNTRINATGWTLREATGINAKGQIVGNGVLNGVISGFVLTPR
jgi:probable HAF family extracellular repeat protein